PSPMPCPRALATRLFPTESRAEGRYRLPRIAIWARGCGAAARSCVGNGIDEQVFHLDALAFRLDQQGAVTAGGIALETQQRAWFLRDQLAHLRRLHLRFG